MEDNQIANITPVVEPQIVKDTITRRVAFKNTTLRDMLTMANFYHFDKNLKQDELLALIIDDMVNYYYAHRFINEIKR
ncbi:MAG: hypothetical protein ACK4M7_00975 [Burkholderiales bacterium]